MKRWARWFVGLVFVGGAAAAAAAAPAAGSASAKPAGRYACVGTASDAELKVDLGAGEGGAWHGEITLTVMGGTGEVSGTVYDVDRVKGKKKPPRLQLKPKMITAAQLAEALDGLADAINRPEEAPWPEFD